MYTQDIAIAAKHRIADGFRACDVGGNPVADKFDRRARHSRQVAQRLLHGLVVPCVAGDEVDWMETFIYRTAPSVRSTPAKPDVQGTSRQERRRIDGKALLLQQAGIEPYFREPSLFVGFPSRYVERKAWTPNYDRLPSPEKRRWRMEKEHGGQPRYGLTVTDCVFIFTRDGQKFCRQDEAFMRPGPENPHNWVYGDCYPAHTLVKTPSPLGGDDEISLFTFDRHWSGLASNLNRYRLRLDGFVSRRATYAAQKVVTKPLVFSGSELLVNFSTSARGRMFVTIRDEAGNSIRSIELFGDKVDRVVDFADGGEVADFAGKPVTVTFEMSDADLYSFRFVTRTE